ncbi:MAG: class II glutamine amidotransferase [Nitrososphaerales archaeon]
MNSEENAKRAPESRERLLLQIYNKELRKGNSTKELCRMLAIIPKRGSCVDADLVRSFRKLACFGMVKPPNRPGHSDGWGVVAWREGRPFYLAREPSDASTDPKYEQVCNLIQESRITSPMIVHFRKASVGQKTVENTHPFLIGEWAFAHNGTIRKLNIRGKTDSEWFFESLMHEKELSGGDLELAMRKQIDSVRAVYQYSSLTFLLSNGREFFAYRDFSNDGDYYTMFFTRTRDSLVLCQERYFDSDWTELGNRQLLKLKNDSAKVSNFSPWAEELKH